MMLDEFHSNRFFVGPGFDRDFGGGTVLEMVHRWRDDCLLSGFFELVQARF
jgi:hypothetical protein